MNVAAIDCSTTLLGVCVARGLGSGLSAPRLPKHPYREEGGHSNADGPGFASICVDSGYRHAERVMGALEFCVAEAGLDLASIDLFACAAGPGSFTGLRIGMATVKGLSLGRGKPFVAVPTLDAIAADWEGAAPVTVPVIDAKRSRFYFAMYEGSRLAAGPFDAGIERLVELTHAYPEVLLVGPDAEMLEQLSAERPSYRIASAPRRSPAPAMARLAAAMFEAQGPSSPDRGLDYLRPSEAEESAADGRRA